MLFCDPLPPLYCRFSVYISRTLEGTVLLHTHHHKKQNKKHVIILGMFSLSLHYPCYYVQI